MSFQKATDLLRLAEMAASRHGGIGLTEIEETFAVDRRTAQRMTKALEETFPNCVTRTDEDRRKYWKLRGEDARLMLTVGLRDSELVALNLALQRASRDGAETEIRALTRLRDRLLAAMPGPHARRAEADAEAVLEAHGFASRPGPMVRVGPDLLGLIAEALKGPHVLALTYNDRARRLEPHGLLLGTRRYLVAREVGESRMQHYRLDRIRDAQLEVTSFARAPGFDLATHAARAFGSYHAEAEYGEVVWRFTPRAAETAREFLFHPTQVMEEDETGLTVRFMASGWLEMAWHLYLWGDQVEVLAPEPLARMVAAHRRGDFPALP
ncbi:helix-turn-helix transcriptional regulator [Stagnihabitans tardus]|uniref:WYL domain-containing protein n=1 Tax=Stagnihabitans tardus TaxID=2699202 RepID=A0AAE4YD64_9RHOB|nr:WYL domain-containing protein [Stagnihabitans tardus]NBZ89123.1 WYL domain-containing protein [Stagnihabitans tardus]